MNARATTQADLTRTLSFCAENARKHTAYRFRFYVTDPESGEDETWSRAFRAADLKLAKLAARRWGDQEFGAGKYDFNPYFGSF